MGITDKRDRDQSPELDPDLVDEGLEQLDAEIRLLDEWLQELESRPDDPVTREARDSYRDMLRSRREMRQALASKRNPPASNEEGYGPSSG